MKKIILVNFFLITCLIWYSEINNLLLKDTFIIINIFKFENINYINILFLLFIELTYYFWSYLSSSTYLSDWRVPILSKSEILPIFKIIIFYLLILLYYSILLK